MNKILRRTLKILGWTVASLVFLLVLVVILIQVPAVQNFARKKIVAFLQQKIGTPVAIGHLSIKFPKMVVLEDIYFEDQHKDTLLAGRKLMVDIDMFKLLKKTVEINDVELEGIRANIYRRGTDTVFNYQYIVNAFVTEQAKPEDTTATPMKFDVKHVRLQAISASFRDDQSGSDMYAYIGDFETRIKKFDLDSLAFDVPTITLKNSVARMYQHKPLVEPRTEAEVTAANKEPMTLKLNLDKVQLTGIDVDFANDVSAVAARIKFRELLAEPELIDLQTLNVKLANLKLHGLDGNIHLGATQQAAEVEEQVNATAQAQVTNPWKFELTKLDLEDNKLKFDNDNSPRVPSGMDYAHLNVQGMKLKGSNMSFTPTAFTGRIDEAAMTEQSGFALQELHTNFVYNDRGASLTDLYLKTDQTELRDTIMAQWTSLESIAAAPGEVIINANLPNCTVAFKDVLTFAPMLATAPPFQGNRNAVMRVNARLGGAVKDLNIENLAVAFVNGFPNTAVAINGRITGLPDANKTVYNLRIPYARTTQSDLTRLLPKGTVPPTVRIPERMSVSGTFAGGLAAFNTNLSVRTSRGDADVKGSIRGMGASYDLTAAVSALDVGYITKQEQTVGRISAAVTARGSGFDPKTMVADLQGRVIQAQAQGYNYRNLDFKAKLARGTATATANMRDPNLRFDLDATAQFNQQFPAVKANIMLDSINLQNLKLYAKDLKIHGRIIADLPSTNPDALQGNVEISDLIVYNEGKRYAPTDTIAINAEAEGENRRITVASEMINADLQGQYKLTEIAPAIQAVINKYYQLPGYQPAPYAPQTWTLTASLLPSTLLYTFVPEMQGSDSIQINVGFNSSAQDLNMLVSAPKIVYGTNQVDSLTVRANSAADALDYALTVEGVASPSYRLSRTTIVGDVANNTLNTNLSVADAANRAKYALGAVLAQTANQGIRISLKDSLLLDYDAWQVQPNNFIEYDANGLVVSNFGISSGTQSLTAASESLTPTAPVKVQFNNFRISTLTNLAEQDSLLADGLINGYAQVQNVTTNPVFLSDLNIQDLSYMTDTVGNLAIKVDNQTANTLAANVQLSGRGNELTLAGTYLIPSQTADMKLDITNIDLAKIKPFSAGQLSDAGGSLKGQFDVTGVVTQPNINGSMHFENAFVTPALLGERYQLTSNPITVNQTGIHFDQFSLTDSSSNTATLDGDLLTSDFRNYRFALDFKANEFTAVNSVKNSTKKPFYGRLNLTTNTRIRGDMNTPQINSYLRINRNTDFTFILPTADPEVQSREGVVQFIDWDRLADSSIFAQVPDSSRMAIKGMDVDATIETDSGALFHIVIDERNGDAVNIRGSAQLQASVDRSGKVSLTGTYIMSEGSYLLTLSPLQRLFNVRAGSSITWNGDPTSATVDITAVYVANTAPLDLVQDQLAGGNASEINRYKQKLPFNVLLNMKGELLKPVITFDIELPQSEQTRWQEVNSKLTQVRNDESELNKQVFALLLLGRFVGPNPLESGAGDGPVAEAFVRQSASRLLTDQLNKLAGNLISGFELNFGVNSGADYSTGAYAQRTDLTVGLSKRLLNDRLRVNVGSSFLVEGPTNNNQQASNIAGDVSVDYQLSKDNRYLIRAYRQNNYESITEGQVIETGATFVFRLDYNNFSDFFRRRPDPADDQKRRKKSGPSQK